tara:strand:- start:819 stop:1001 length:183 start_codon:yes stop_codon:yes gene_type:complete
MKEIKKTIDFEYNGETHTIVVRKSHQENTRAERMTDDELIAHKKNMIDRMIKFKNSKIHK